MTDLKTVKKYLYDGTARERKVFVLGTVPAMIETIEAADAIVERCSRLVNVPVDLKKFLIDYVEKRKLMNKEIPSCPSNSRY